MGCLNTIASATGHFGSKYGDWPISESISDQNSPKEIGYINTRQETALPTPTAAEGYFSSFPGELDARDYLGNRLAAGSNAPAEWTGTSIPNSAGTRNYIVNNTASTPQTIELKILAYCGTSGGSTLPIYLNGAPIYTSGTSWLNIAYSSAALFSDSTTVSITLQPGLNTLRLVYTSSSNICTNSLKFSNTSGTFVSNTLPNIGTIGQSQAVLEGVNYTNTFTVNDLETPLSNLSIGILSSNLALYPAANISVTTTSTPGTFRYSVTPVAGITGAANIIFTITDGGGLSRSDAIPFTVTPSAPTTLAVTAGTIPQSQVNLTWTNTSSAYKSTRIDVSTSSTFSSQTSYLAAKGATSFTVTGLSAGTQYYFRVYSYDSSPPAKKLRFIPVFSRSPPLVPRTLPLRSSRR